MNIVIGESWSGNTLVYYPSRKDWGVKIDSKVEECTEKDLEDAKKAIEIRSYLIIDVLLEDYNVQMDA